MRIRAFKRGGKLSSLIAPQCGFTDANALCKVHNDTHQSNATAFEETIGCIQTKRTYIHPSLHNLYQARILLGLRGQATMEIGPFDANWSNSPPRNDCSIQGWTLWFLLIVRFSAPPPRNGNLCFRIDGRGWSRGWGEKLFRGGVDIKKCNCPDWYFSGVKFGRKFRAWNLKLVIWAVVNVEWIND